MTFSVPAHERLELYLGTQGEIIEQLTPDASTREYFRVQRGEQVLIACVYPEQFDAAAPQIDITRLFIAGGLPVARIEEFDGEAGIVLHEDFGDLILRTVLTETKKKDEYLSEAIRLISVIQAATSLAFESNSIASRLKFDVEKLTWELAFFKEHYFSSLGGRGIEPSFSNALDADFLALSIDLQERANVLTHRDFHAANLMVQDNKLKIIDHQDARIGTATYDLVSLLLDRIETVPTENELSKWKSVLNHFRNSANLDPVADFETDFALTSIQRCLKAIGTFSNQTAVRGKKGYLGYIAPMFAVVASTCRDLGRFEAIGLMAENESKHSWADHPSY
ncbi:MAG: phosphotransferase [Pyrinomonadaceae bacterium]